MSRIELDNGKLDVFEDRLQSIVDADLKPGESIKRLIEVVEQVTGERIDLSYDIKRVRSELRLADSVIRNLRDIDGEKPVISELYFHVGDERLVTVGVSGDMFFGRPNVIVAQHALGAIEKLKNRPFKLPNGGK